MSRPDFVEHPVGAYRIVVAVNSAARCETFVYPAGETKPSAVDKIDHGSASARAAFIAEYLPEDLRAIALDEFLVLTDKIAAARGKAPRADAPTDADALPYEPTELAPDEQDGPSLFADLRHEVKRYVWMGTSEVIAIALWILLTHALDAFDETPYLHVQAPEKRCGKTTLLDVLAGVCARAVRVSSMSVSFLFRALDAFKLTLLIDEIGAWLDGPNVGELRGVLNDGSKRNGKVGRTEKRTKNGTEEFHPTYYGVFGPKAFSGYGKSLPDDTLDRCIPIKLARADDEARKGLAKLRSRRFDADARILRGRCARWAVDHVASLRDARVTFPPGLTGRQEDIWEPLLAIAAALGGDALRDAREATSALTGTRSLSLGERLLEDLLSIFAPNAASPDEDPPAAQMFVPTAEIVETLIDGDREEWRALPATGKPMTPEMIASLLKPYEVPSIRGKGRDGKRARGYAAAALLPAWSGYLETPDAKARTARISAGCAAAKPSDQLTALDTLDGLDRKGEVEENESDRADVDTLDGMDRMDGKGEIEQRESDGVIRYADGSQYLTPARIATLRAQRAAKGGV